MVVSVTPATSIELELLNQTLCSPFVNGADQLFKDRLSSLISPVDMEAVEIVAQARPEALRIYDQIPMRSRDLLRQVTLIAPYLAGKFIVFMGDYDSTSLLIGLLVKRGSIPSPKSMLLLDFDERLLSVADKLATQYDFQDILETRLYNAFDPIPSELIGKFDWFYTNPPYGSHNLGESARLFITRGCELARQNVANGCIILPDDEFRPWTRSAMHSTQRFLCECGWTIDEKINKLHRYYLDDDRELASSVILVKRNSDLHNRQKMMHYAARKVDFDEIPYFYGRSVSSPYPRYILQDGKHE